MTQSLFQRDVNDEIAVADMTIENPYPAGLEVRATFDQQIFYAKPGFVLKSVYSSLDSLDAFSSDGSTQVYVIYARDGAGKESVFLSHSVDPREETLSQVSIWDLPAEAQAYVPQGLR